MPTQAASQTSPTAPFRGALHVFSRRESVARDLERRFRQEVSADHASPAHMLRCVRPSGASAVIVDILSASPEEVIEAVAQVRGTMPGLPVLAYCERSRDGVAALGSVLHIGIDAVLLEDVRNSSERSGDLLEEARGQSIYFALRDRIGSGPIPALRLVRYCLMHPSAARSVSSCATALHASRRTVYEWCVSSGFPGPEEVIGFCRLLRAAQIIEHERTPAGVVARRLGYPSPSAMRNQLRRYMGVRPLDLVHGGVAFAIDAFVACLPRTQN